MLVNQDITKDVTVVSDFPLNGKRTLQKQPPKCVLQICVWQLLLKLFKMYVKESI